MSKINGRALQVAKTDDGGLIVNGAGDLGPTAQNGINLSNIILKEIVNLNKKRLFCHYKWNARIKYIIHFNETVQCQKKDASLVDISWNSANPNKITW